MVEFSRNVCPLPTTVTLMMYRIITPLMSSSRGGSQVMLAEVAEPGMALKFSGGALGAKKRSFMIMMLLEHSLSYNLPEWW